MIVLSILLAFGIDAWWDARQDVAAEQALLGGLEQDMARNQREAARVLSNIRQSAAATVVFLESSPEALLGLSADSVATMGHRQRGIAGLSGFDASDGVLRTGDLSLLRDQGLRDALGEWSRRTTNLESGQSLLTNGMWELRVRGGQVAPEFFFDNTLKDPRSLVALGEDREFVAIELAVQASRTAYANILGTVSEQTDSVLAMIRAQRR